MDDLSAESAHLVERGREVGYGEIGQREAVSWTRPTLVQSEHDADVFGLPTLSLVAVALDERRPQQLLPEAPRPVRLVCRKLKEERRRHRSDGTEKDWLERTPGGQGLRRPSEVGPEVASFMPSPLPSRSGLQEAVRQSSPRAWCNSSARSLAARAAVSSRVSSLSLSSLLSLIEDRFQRGC